MVLLKRGCFKADIPVLAMFLSPENDRYLRAKHRELGLCPGLLNRLYEQYLPMRRLLAPFLKGSQGSACTLAHRTLQWDGLVGAPKERPGRAAQIRCLLQLCPSPHYNVRGFGTSYGAAQEHGGSFTFGLPPRDRQVEVKLWRASV